MAVIDMVHMNFLDYIQKITTSVVTIFATNEA